MLSAPAGAWADGFAAGARTGVAAAVPGEDGQCGGPTDLPAAGSGGGVSLRLVEGEVWFAEVPLVRKGQGAERVGVGLSGAQRDDLETAGLATVANKRRGGVRKPGEPTSSRSRG